jgi:outer membrane lipoprotein-sorting protein
LKKAVIVALVLCSSWAFAQAAPSKANPSANGQGAVPVKTSEKTQTATPAPPAQPAPSANHDLDAILKKMDETAAGFRSAQAKFVWDQFEAVVSENTLQTGVMYLRRNGDRIDMMADVTGPAGQEKSVLFTGDTVQLYQPKINQLTAYRAGKNREAFQSFLTLGLGGSGDALLKQFAVKYAGRETVDGVATVKLELTPKSASVRNVFNLMVLWIDPQTGLSRQQQFFEPGDPGMRNYRLAKYTDIKKNEPLGDVFKLKTNSKTTRVTH